ncbi:MAG: TatD family hydrolase [Terrimonas sp.]|nr:TatD family hydrolase [Terrimonas sp.]OJY99600.1 MAG: hydrolase TatD [Sphingobacteriales bacterium 40-81]
MSVPLVDYHCHLDLYPDFENIIEECEKNEVHTLAVTTTPKAFPRNYELISKKKYVRAALGLHPQLVANRVDEIEIWKQYFDETRYIGEVGLDAGTQYYKSFELQKSVFQTILNTCANSREKILSIHSVRSVPIVLEMLERSSVLKKNKVVLHWFGGNANNLRKAVSLGCYFSINAEMFKSERSKELIRLLPLDKLLTETDGPFTYTNQVASRPINVLKTVELLAAMLGQEIASLAETLLSNLKKIES